MARKIIARNRKAKFDYNIQDTYEAGLVLRGTEIKSIRAGQVAIQDGYVERHGSELYLVNVRISPYDQGAHFNHDPLRDRKLLLHRREINQIVAAIEQKGLTAIPTQLYLRDGMAKVEVAVARGKRKYDKREEIARRDAERRIEREIRNYYG